VSVQHVSDKFTIIKIWRFIKQKFVVGARSEVIRWRWAVRNLELENMSWAKLSTIFSNSDPEATYQSTSVRMAVLADNIWCKLKHYTPTYLPLQPSSHHQQMKDLSPDASIAPVWSGSMLKLHTATMDKSPQALTKYCPTEHSFWMLNHHSTKMLTDIFAFFCF